MSRNALVTFSVLLYCASCCRAYEVVNSTQIKLEQDSGLKNYTEEEDGKVVPYRFVLYYIIQAHYKYLHATLISGHF